MINMAAASLLSTNTLNYCVILFVKKPFCATLLFRRRDSWQGLQWNMCWDTYAPLHLEPPPRLILFLRVFRGCFYTAILVRRCADTLLKRTFLPLQTEVTVLLYEKDGTFSRGFWVYYGLSWLLRCFFSDVALPDSGVFSGTSVFHRSTPASTKRASSNS